MPFLGVSVDYYTPDRPILKTSTSGIKICDHFVLTHGSLVCDLLKKCVSNNSKLIYEDCSSNFISNKLVQFIHKSNTKFGVVLHQEVTKLDVRETSCVKQLHATANVDMEKENNENNLELFQESCCTYIDAYLEHVFISPLMLLDFSQLFPKRKVWKFKKNASCENVSMEDNHYEDIYLSTFLILRIENGGDMHSCLSLFEKLITSPKKGATLYIDGCPFGVGGSRSLFLNSLSKGIVCNVNQTGNIFLTDARCILGCEGAPAYSFDCKFGVCGIVLSPFCWLKGEWIGLTFMAALKPLVSYMKEAVDSKWSSDSVELRPLPLRSIGEDLNYFDDRMRGYSTQQPTRVSPYLDESVGDTCKQRCGKFEADPLYRIKDDYVLDAVRLMDKCIVRISCENTVDWGTGVVVSAARGLVITCAHVIVGAKNKIVNVVFSTGEHLRGLLLFSTNPLLKGSRQDLPKDMWDLAIILLLTKPAFSLPIATELPAVGAPVLIGGHPLFRLGSLPQPTFSQGNLAKICRIARQDINLGHDSQTGDDFGPRNMVEDMCGTFSQNSICSKWQSVTLWDKYVPVVLQTTCAVYSGMSGGPVVALHPSKGPFVIGIICCCVRDVKGKVSFPHVNMAVPSFLLAEAVEQFDLTNDVSAFDVLKIRSSSGLSLWSLNDANLSKL